MQWDSKRVQNITNIELHDVLKTICSTVITHCSILGLFAGIYLIIGKEICLKSVLTQKMLNYKLTNLNKLILFYLQFVNWFKKKAPDSKLNENIIITCKQHITQHTTKILRNKFILKNRGYLKLKQTLFWFLYIYLH